MTFWTETILVLLLLSDLLLLGSSRLTACIRAVAFQGFVLAFLPLLASPTGVTPRLAALAVMVMAFKGFVFPWLLVRALREASVHREVQPFVGYTTSILAGVLVLGLSLWLDSALDLPAGTGSRPGGAAAPPPPS